MRKDIRWRCALLVVLITMVATGSQAQARISYHVLRDVPYENISISVDTEWASLDTQLGPFQMALATSGLVQVGVLEERLRVMYGTERALELAFRIPPGHPVWQVEGYLWRSVVRRELPVHVHTGYTVHGRAQAVYAQVPATAGTSYGVKVGSFSRVARLSDEETVKTPLTGYAVGLVRDHSVGLWIDASSYGVRQRALRQTQYVDLLFGRAEPAFRGVRVGLTNQRTSEAGFTAEWSSIRVDDTLHHSVRLGLRYQWRLW